MRHRHHRTTSARPACPSKTDKDRPLRAAAAPLPSPAAPPPASPPSCATKHTQAMSVLTDGQAQWGAAKARAPQSSPQAKRYLSSDVSPSPKRRKVPVTPRAIDSPDTPAAIDRPGMPVAIDRPDKPGAKERGAPRFRFPSGWGWLEAASADISASKDSPMPSADSGTDTILSTCMGRPTDRTHRRGTSLR
jgi:hypothetical protein